jgi:hypothetical protein
LLYFEDVEHKRAMFGDAFGSRGDYSKGFFYGGRRKVLAAPLKPPKPTTAGTSEVSDINALELPEMFMSKAQTKKHRNGTKGIQFKLAFTDTKAEGEGGFKPSKNFVKKQDDKKMKMKRMLYLDRYSSTRREDWTESHQAGCTFYTNHATGEATVERPYDLDLPSPSSPPPGKLLPPLSPSPIKPGASMAASSPGGIVDSESQSICALAAADDDGIEFEVEGEGTGAYVYDGSELTSFLSLLDQHCEEQRRKDEAKAAAEEAKRKAKITNKYQRH